MGWPMVRLDSLYNIARGGSPRPIKDFITDDPEGVNWIKIGDATASGKYIYETKEKIKPEGISRSRLVKKGDFILSNSMSFGRPYIMGTDGCIHDGWLVLSAKDDSVEQNFLYHVLGSPFVFSQFDSLAAGSTVRNLNIDLVSSVKIPLLPIPEQQRIVAILDQAFADIEKARANAEKNLKNARELFDSYLNQVFSQRGEGWVEHKLVEVVDVIDSLHKTPKYSDTGYAMVRVTDIKPGALDLSKTRKVCKATYEEFSKRYKARVGDIVFSRVGSYGKSSIVTSNEPFCLGQNTVFLAPSMNGYYFYYFLNSPRAKEQIDNLVAGTTQPTVSLKSLKSLVIPIPAAEIQLKIVTKLNHFSDEIGNLESIYKNKLSSLEELKKSLLQKAFSGELTKTEGHAA